MEDLISRQAVIDICANAIDLWSGQIGEGALVAVRDMIAKLPSTQPERLTDDDFETIRIHLNAYKEKLCNQHRWKEAEEYERLIERFMTFASGQPEIIRCKDCRWWDKYGDYDNGYCMAAKHGHWSRHWEISIRRTYEGDFYCADAEMRGERNE